MDTWNVSLLIEGPIEYRGPRQTTQQKGFRPEDPFYSELNLRTIPSGISADVTARADTSELAQKAATYFIGKMLDVLAVEIDQPLTLSAPDDQTRGPRRRYDVRRLVELDKIQKAFGEAYLLSRACPWFLRSLGWYRKGLQTDDPFDAYLALGNAIEIVVSREYPKVPDVDLDRAKKGAINQVWACFIGLWGATENWPIAGWTESGGAPEKWASSHYDIRNHVAHGVTSVDVHKIAEVDAHVPGLRQVARAFLLEWRDQFLDPRIQPELEGSEALEDFY